MKRFTVEAREGGSAVIERGRKVVKYFSGRDHHERAEMLAGEMQRQHDERDWRENTRWFMGLAQAGEQLGLLK